MVDLSGLSGGINNMISFLNDKIAEGNWQDSNYQSSPIQKEINKFVASAITNVLKQGVYEDEGSETYFDVMMDAMQGFARGDQGEVQTTERAMWQDALRSDDFATKIRNSLCKSVLKLTEGDDDYSILKTALKTSIKPASANLVTVNGSGAALTLLGYLISGMKTPGDVLSFLKLSGTNLIPDSVGEKIANMAADMQLAWTVDTNIPNDSDWDFHTVIFYPNNGSDYVIRTATIEGCRAAMFPTLSMDGYKFTGWYTAEGVLVTADTDLTGIYRLYGDWEYDDDDWNEYWDDDDDLDDWDDDWDEQLLDQDEKITIKDYVDHVEEIEKELDKIIKVQDQLIPVLQNIVNNNVLPNSTPVVGPGNTSPIAVPGSTNPMVVTNPTTGAVYTVGGVGVITPSVVDNKLVDQNGNTIKNTIFISPQGTLCVNFDRFSFLTPDLVKMFDSCNMDIEIFYMKNGKLCRFIIPKGTKLSRYADKSGFIGIQYLESIINDLLKEAASDQKADGKSSL